MENALRSLIAFLTYQLQYKWMLQQYEVKFFQFILKLKLYLGIGLIDCIPRKCKDLYWRNTRTRWDICCQSDSDVVHPIFKNNVNDRK